MASLRPPVTYARRRTLRASTPSSQRPRSSLPSSPLEDLSPCKHDVTLSEMSRRMKKRSRQVVSGKQPATDADAVERLAKKLRRPSPPDLHGAVEDCLISTVPTTPVNHHNRSFPLDTQQIYDSLFETPYHPHPSDGTLIKSYVEPLASADSLSPIPVARRMLSRTSSRNLKENSGRMSRQGLASPFTSRPSSRTSSPRRASKTQGRRPLHTKSRTLSNSFINQSVKSAGTSHSTTLKKSDATYDSIFSSTAPGSVLSTSAHSRSGSIPTMPSHLLDHIHAEDWLVPARALSRSQLSLEDMELDDWATEHASFYLDAPAKISTPPRKRRTTVTLKNYRPSASLEQPQSQEEPMDLTDVVTGAEDQTARDVGMQPAPGSVQPCRRRRTVVHMSSDSIFSSALDFSAYMTEFSPTKVHGTVNAGPTRPSALPSNDNAVDPSVVSVGTPAPSGLDPAFSPALGPVPGPQESVSMPNTPAASDLVSRSLPRTPGATCPPLSRRAASLQTPGRDALNDMFKTLGLSGISFHICADTDVMLTVLFIC